MKRMISLVLMFTLLFAMAIPVHAAVKEEAVPLYDEINTVTCDISLNKTWGIVSCTGSVTAKEVVPVKVIVTLQKYEDGRWQSLKSWSNTGTMNASSANNQYAVYSGYSYRVYVTGYVYDNNGVIQESASITKTVYYPSN